MVKSQAKTSEKQTQKQTQKQHQTRADTPQRASSGGGSGQLAGILTLQRTAGNQAVDQALRGNDQGQPLDPSTRSTMERRFGQDFGAVRLHTGERAATSARSADARAYTFGQDIFFGAGQYAPHTAQGRTLLAHELAHVVQQTGTGATSSPHDLETAAKRAAGSPLLPVNVGMGRRSTVQFSKLSDNLTDLWGATGSKGVVFDKLREVGPVPDPDVEAWIKKTFSSQPDDCWLALNIQKFGPEPLWPSAELDERGKRAKNNNWAPEAGNIEGTIGQSSGLSPGTKPMPIKAYYFPGQDDTKRALVIGGVHGSELAGVEVANRLRDSLEQRFKATKKMPLFTTIIVPELFPENVAKARAAPSTIKPGSRASNVGREVTVPNAKGKGTKQIQTARQFPIPGQTLADMEKAGGPAADKKGTRLKDAEGVPVPILEETKVLLKLIERFRPTRIASVHSFRFDGTPDAKKDAPGVFVDPRGGLDNKGKPNTQEGKDDDKLALDIAREADKKGAKVPGNWLGKPEETAHYKNLEKPPGFSLGDWGPVASGTRQGMTTITVEVQNYYESKQDPSGDREKELKAHSEALMTKFLD